MKRPEGLRRFRKLPPAPKAHPFTKVLYDAMNREQIGVLDMAERSGVSKNTITGWRTKDVPQIEGLRACLNVVGLDLAIVQQSEEDDPSEATKPLPFGLTRQENEVFEALLRAPRVRALTLCIAAVEAHEDPIEIGHLYSLLSKIRKKTRAEILSDGGVYSVLNRSDFVKAPE